MTSDLRERVAEAIYLAWCKANHVEHTSMPWAEVWGGERKITLTEADAAIALIRGEVLEEAARAIEKRAVELGRQECCGSGVGGYESPQECCCDPLYMISNEEAAAAIRALKEVK